ncbi:MAG TPA: N-carbamoyl-D-amino-acid hydrolase [Acidimicrobiales bacterium]|nr:N-carbamoyl-D-amino-acid hydrolase [Acidimicrobiales bacterium]
MTEARRIVHVAAAQMGPTARDDGRPAVVERLIALLREAAGRGADLVVFPELALTTFFPRWWYEDGDPALDAWYETDVPGPDTKPLWDEAARLGVGFTLGFAELTPAGERFNTAILVGAHGHEVGRYRKIHLPGHGEHEPWRPFQHLEKRYFRRGDLGFPTFDAFGGRVGMLICNDRRWPEAFRALGLQGVELVCIGYNTPVHNPLAPEHDRFGDFHNHLVMQAGAYQNGTFVVGVAKAGVEEGIDHVGGSCVIHPSGTIVAECTGLGDEVVVAACGLDETVSYKTTVFDFALHRQPDQYRSLTDDGSGI